MAFNFNWSPLIADTDRVREMLTSSLNKGSKPPIIVDDIIVNELNLGSTPPELEILEIGDLAEDKFRGIFKMSYTGDAYLTLKTRVQANPLKTYLSAKTNTFASPMPLAAGSGLVIPLQITLSDIRLSGFVILVFSKQKGITLVFRNDPIESLKVSSTFDSIPFVRDYLQKTIESQLRVLFMEDLPAIIHRLSLKMFNPEYQDTSVPEPSAGTSDTRRPIDPFASPSRQGVDASGLALDDFSLDTPTETYASFSQKNLLRLAALSESQRTLSLFTPSIRDTVYRAWASAADRNTLASGTATPAIRPTTLSRIQSTLGSPGGMSSAASQISDSASQATRPSLASMQSSSTVYSFNTGRPRQRKRKHRVVNLRKNSKAEGNEISDTVSVSSGYTESASHSASQSASGSAGLSMAQTDPTSRTDSYYYRDGEISTPPQSPEKRRGSRKAESVEGGATIKKRQTLTHRPSLQDIDATPRASMYLPKEESLPEKELPRMKDIPNVRPSLDMPRTASELSLLGLGAGSARSPDQQFTGGILSQAWMRKGAMEVARKVEEERARRAQYGAAGN